MTARPDSPSLLLSVFSSLIESHSLCHSLSLSYTLFTHSYSGCKRHYNKKCSTLVKHDSLIPVKNDGWTGCIGRVNCFVYMEGQ